MDYVPDYFCVMQYQLVCLLCIVQTDKQETYWQCLFLSLIKFQKGFTNIFLNLFSNENFGASKNEINLTLYTQ